MLVYASNILNNLNYIPMNRELQKLIVFGAIIAVFTSAYVTFLDTGLKQGFFTDGFWLKWLTLIPKAYIIVLPFILITGPLVRKLVDRIFGDHKKKLSDN
jgi:hypothetical protein